MVGKRLAAPHTASSSSPAGLERMQAVHLRPIPHFSGGLDNESPDFPGRGSLILSRPVRPFPVIAVWPGGALRPLQARRSAIPMD